MQKAALMTLKPSESTPLPADGAKAAPAEAEPRPSAAPAAREGGWTGKLAATPWVASTYFAEGLPYSIVHQVADKFFLFMGVPLGTLSLTSLYHIPWLAKFLWSPFVDRYSTVKRWLCVTEALVGLLVMAMAIPAQWGALVAVACVLGVVSFVAATHDIAIDGFYLRALRSERDQTALAGLRIAAYRVAMLFGSGFLVALAGRTSWRACFLVAGGVLVILAVVHAARLPREALPQPGGRDAALLRRRFIEGFRTFLQQPRIGVILAFIALYRAGDVMMFAMSSALLKSLGVKLIGMGGLSGLGTGVSIAGAIAGGAMIARWSLKRTLVPIATVQGLAILLYVALATERPGITWIVVAVVLEQFIAGVGNAALAVFLMRRCKGEHKAAHFAIGSSLMSVALTGFGLASGTLAQRVGFPVFFTLAYAMSIPGIVLSWWAPKE